MIVKKYYPKSETDQTNMQIVNKANFSVMFYFLTKSVYLFKQKSTLNAQETVTTLQILLISFLRFIDKFYID